MKIQQMMIANDAPRLAGMKSPSKAWHGAKVCILAALLILFWCPCEAQTQAMAQDGVTRGTGRPNSSIKSHWYHSTDLQQLWVKRNGKWKKYPCPFIAYVLPCGTNVLLAFHSFAFLVDENGIDIETGDNGGCFDSLAWVGDSENASLYLGKTIIGWTRMKDVMPLSDTLSGIPVICASRLEARSKLSRDAPHAWGMMGYKGQWLIEPKFDEPFHIRNGIAEVLYYGQKRKINEKGEFVESLDRRSQ